MEELTKTVQELMDEKQSNQSNVADRKEVEELQAEVNRLKTVYVWLFCYLSHPHLTQFHLKSQEIYTCSERALSIYCNLF